MARLPELDPTRLDAEQKAAYDAIVAGPRGVVRGPLAVWVRRPQLANKAQALGQYCRFDSSLPKRLSELAILVTARAWRAEFEWWGHKPQAIEAGVSEAIVEAIRTEAKPVFDKDDEATVYEISLVLNRDRHIPDPLYKRGIAVLGEAGMIDLVGALGYYALVSMTINAFEVDIPGAAKPAFS